MKIGDRSQAVLWTLFFLAMMFPAAAAAGNLRFTSETILRVFERDTTEQEDAKVVPAYEYIQAEAGALEEEGLSFHLYGWGRADFGEGDFYDDDTAGELLYGYFRYAQPDSGLEVKLGRLYVFEGVANESVDGLRVSSGLGPHFAASVYGGFPVALDSTDGRSGDRIWGGRISHHRGTDYDIGLSYKQVEDDGDEEEEMLGVDLSLALPKGVSLYGFSSRNLDSEGWGEHSYEVRFSLADFHIRPYFQLFQYEDLFATGANSANPFPFLRDTGEELAVLGGDVLWRKHKDWDLGAKVKFYDYDERGDSSQFYSGLVTWHGEALSQIGGELGYMEGDAAENDYLLARAYVYWEQLPQDLPLGFVTGDLVYVYYDEEIFGEDDALFLSLGAGSRFFDEALEIKLSGDYSSDPFFDSDLRGMLVAKYVFDR